MKKRLLLIAPVYFGYYKDIMQEAKRVGFEVDFICDAPSNSNVSKALGRVNKKLIQIPTTHYFKKEVMPVIEKNTYDIVLVIAGMTFAFTQQMVKTIKESQPKARFIMYQWDSEKILPYCTMIHPYFDELYTFDRIDATAHSKYKFLPMFYNEVYESIGKSHPNSYTYDCMYVGTAHPKKYAEVNNMAKALKGAMPRQFIYHYMPSRLKYIYQKVKDPLFKKAKWSEFQQAKLSKDEMIDVYTHSKCVLDAPQAWQNGLTVRSIECLGAKRKLITTNEDVQYYDFYNENNIYIYKGSFDYEAPFFKNAYEELPKDVYEKYSLRNWFKTIVQE